MNKPIKKIVTASTLLLTGMYAINQYIDTCITPISISNTENTFSWKDININYTVKGRKENPALLLIHNLYPSFSKEEWYRIDNALSNTFHVYELDLPGCGKSDKPNITYINYMYVQIISDFVKEVIGTKTNICATAFSSSFSLMAARFHSDLLDKIIIINPPSMDELVKPMTNQGKLQEIIMQTPIIGTFLYNCVMSKAAIIDDYKYLYFHNDKNIPEKAIDISYFNAHYKHSSGKHLLGSILGNYTNINIIHALSKIDNEVYLIGNGKYKEIMQQYKKYNPNIHVFYVSNCKLLPQLEIPETIVEKINSILVKTD